MSVPTQTDMFYIVLKLMQDGVERSRSSIRTSVSTMLELTEDELNVKTSSGKPAYASRADWAVTYLDRAKYLDRVKRGVYIVNDDGRTVYESGVQGSELFKIIRKRIDKIDPWHLAKKTQKEFGGSLSDADDTNLIADTVEKSPQEQIGDLAEEMNESLGDELLNLIMEKDSDFFERLVVDLIASMGYGEGEVTSRSHDGGIDGLVTTDELGFRPIYTQAKRYCAGNTVGRPMLQSFVGALNGARNGVFITTSSFTKDAVDYAKSYPNATISLIDGRRLAELMIKYDLGVTTETVIKLKRVDSDYFEDA